MVQKTHSFIDIAVLDGVREPFLRGDALALLSEDLGEVLWANGAGAALLRLGDIEAARNVPANIPYAARGRISATPGFPRMSGEHALAVRLSPGSPLDAAVSSVGLPSGESAVMLRVPAPAWAGADAPARAISGIAEAGHFAALLDSEGRPLAASEGFAALAIEADELAALARDVSSEADRLAKRMVRAGGQLYPAGIARLADDPARHMVIIVDDPRPLEEEAEMLAEQPAAPQIVPAATALPPVVARPVQSDDYDSWYFTDQPPVLTPTQDAALDGPVPNFEVAAAEAAEDDRPATATPENAPPGEAGRADALEPSEQHDGGEAAAILDQFTAQQADDADIAAPEILPVGDSDPATAGSAGDAGQAAEPQEAAFVDGPDAVSETPRPASTADGSATAGMAGDAPEDAAGREAAAVDTVVSRDAAPSPAFSPEPGGGPVRFVWRTDAQGRFSAMSGEFAGAVGPAAADVVGQPFREVARRFGLDPDGEIAGLLERRDTWSGRTVMWPVEGAGLRVPVDLAALPVYARDRSFEGFRGFGVARVGDAVPDPEATGLKLAPPAPARVAPQDKADPAGEEARPAAAEPPRDEAQAVASGGEEPERRSDKVIRLAEHRPVAPERQLSSGEKLAFAEIGARLKQARDEAAAANGETPPERPEAGAPAARQPGASADAAEATHDLTGDARASLPEAGAAEAGVAEAPVDEAAGEAAAGLPASETPPAAQAGRATAEPAETEPADDEAGAEKPAASEVPDEGEAESAEVLEFTPSAFSRAPARDPGIDTSILERLPVPVLIHSGDTLHYANEEFLTLTGYQTVEQLEYAGGLGALFAEAPVEGAPGADHRRRLRTRSGKEFPVEALLQSVPWHRGKALLLALKPAAGAAAGELAELEARVAEMRAILDTATDGIVMLARDGTIRSISRPAEALFGFDSETVAGKPFVSLFAVESQRAARDYLNGLSDHGVASVLNDGREVIGREAMGRFIPLFMTIGKLPGDSGYCAVLRDITQWKRAEDELTRARSEAERASSQKTEFLARISHEIRTPLNAIIGFSELMLDEKFGPIVNERYRDYLRDINRSGNHVLDLVNDLLDISKIEAGEQEMSYEAVSLNEALAEAVAMMQPQANRDRVIIRSSYASRLPEVVADLRSVRQIALNLLSNAVRFTQAGGQVIVSTAYEPSGDVVMRVRDTGIGMSQGEIEQALKPFKQINALKRARGDGTGLGLPLTKAMVEANRARFSISSAPGEGTLVEIVFPPTRVLAG